MILKVSALLESKHQNLLYARASCVCYAGNDINELYAPNTSLKKYRHFWVLSNSFLAQVCLFFLQSCKFMRSLAARPLLCKSYMTGAAFVNVTLQEESLQSMNDMSLLFISEEAKI